MQGIVNSVEDACSMQVQVNCPLDFRTDDACSMQIYVRRSDFCKFLYISLDFCTKEANSIQVCFSHIFIQGVHAALEKNHIDYFPKRAAIFHSFLWVDNTYYQFFQILV
jgi:hypothetical protein